MCFGLPSALIRRAFSSQTHRFENENAYICVLVWTVENASKKKNDDRKLRRRACLWHAHRVSLTSQRAILSFSKVLGRLVENALKR